MASVHAHPLAVVTLNCPVPPDAGNELPLIEAEYVHGSVPAACVTVNVLPAIVSVPVRLDVEVLAATVNPAVEDPVPPAPAVIHGTFEVDVQAQPAAAVTPTLPLPPAAPID